VTVFLAPHGGPAAEVSVSLRGAPAWTVTLGPDVPAGVIAAIAYTALALPGPDTTAQKPVP
jgi:hypothetical protein